MRGQARNGRRGDVGAVFELVEAHLRLVAHGNDGVDQVVLDLHQFLRAAQLEQVDQVAAQDGLQAGAAQRRAHAVAVVDFEGTVVQTTLLNMGFEK